MDRDMESLTRSSLMQYAFLAVPLSFAGLPLYIHAPDHYSAGLGISLGAIGAAIILVRVFDAIQDPLIGYLSNRYAYLRPAAMLAGMAVMAASFLALFNPPAGAGIIWFTICLLLSTSAFSVVSINFNALGSLWAEEAREKTRITAWREGLGLIGLLAAAALPSLFGLAGFSLALAGLLLIAALVFRRWHDRHAPVLIHREGAHRRFEWSKLRVSDNLWFFGIAGLSMLAAAIPAVLVLFFIRDRLDAEHLSGLFLILYFLSGAAGMPVWQALASRIGASQAWLASMGVAIVTFGWAFSLGAGDSVAFAVICAFSGFALGAELALPPAILSGLIDRRGDPEQTSFYFSIFSFLSKLSLAIGSGVAFMILGQSAFVPGADNEPAALTALGYTYALLPCAIKLAAAAALAIWLKSSQHGGGNALSRHTFAHGGNNGT